MRMFRCTCCGKSIGGDKGNGLGACCILAGEVLAKEIDAFHDMIGAAYIENIERDEAILEATIQEELAVLEYVQEWMLKLGALDEVKAEYTANFVEKGLEFLSMAEESGKKTINVMVGQLAI